MNRLWTNIKGFEKKHVFLYVIGYNNNTDTIDLQPKNLRLSPNKD